MTNTMNTTVNKTKAPRKPTKKQREAMAAAKRVNAASQFVVSARFLTLCLAAYLLDFLPILNAVLGMFETYFHELGHALVGLITGSNVSVMELNWDGSGLVGHSGPTQGLWWIARALTAWWGYAGAISFGVLLYWLMTIPLVRGRVVLWSFAGVIMVSMLWLARDLTTWIIGSLLAMTLCGLGFALRLTVRDRLFPGKLLVQFIGIALIVLSMKSAWALWGINPPHDASSLANTTRVFQFVWITSWELFGLASLWFLFRRDMAKHEQS